MKKKRVKAIFSGRVQGVGFRYTAQHFASIFQVCGTVRNLPDGSVEVYAEAEEVRLDQFLRKLNDRFKQVIVHLEVELHESTTPFCDFRIVY